jgi:LacI family transcriptional regulator
MSGLEEIAEKLGISTATVSRALNNKPGVSAETRDQVQALAAQMNYAPSIAARSLATSSTHTIGFLSIDRHLPLAADPFYLHVMRGAELELSRRGYFLIVSTVDIEKLPDAKEMLLLREKRVDGLIVPSPFFSEHFIRSVKATGIPLVMVDNSINHPAVDTILVEDEAAGYDATCHLVEHGYHEIAAIGGPNNWPSSHLRGVGYKRAIQEAGLTERIFYEENTTPENGYQAMRRVFQAMPNVEAVFSINDAMALGAIRAAQEAGCQLPKDLAVIGVDDVDMAALITPTLTTMRVPKRHLGIMAARRLIQIIRNPSEPAVISMIASELVIRSSCGCRT